MTEPPRSRPRSRRRAAPAAAVPVPPPRRDRAVAPLGAGADAGDDVGDDVGDDRPPEPPRLPGDARADGAAGLPGGVPGGLDLLFERFPTRTFARGEVLIENTRHRDPPQPGSLAFVHEGLVRGAWHSPFIAPGSRAATLVAGDGRWIGADAFKYGTNLFRYDALTDTSATVIPLADFRAAASRETLLEALHGVSLDWCAAASVLSFGTDTLVRRTMLLLYNLFRLHPRPEIEVRQQDVAELLGVSRQSIQPALKRLERAGLVSLGYGEIVVGDPDALLEVLQRKRPLPRG